MNILMILSNSFIHDPRVYNEAISLIKAGYTVTVLAWDKKRENPSVEPKDGINVVRSYNTKFMNLLPYNIFKMHFWWNKGYNDALVLHKKNPFDVVHCHDFDTLPIGVKLKKKLNIKLVYDAHEIWGYMVANDLPGCWANYYLRKERRLLKHVDEFIIAEDKYAEYFNRFTSKKLTSILNCKRIVSKEYMSPGDKGIFTLLFIGILSAPRFILELVEAANGLEKVRCIIGGVGKTKYIEALKQKCKDTNNVEFIGQVPLEEVIPMTQESSAVVCMINPDVINNKIATANKQFEAMVSGRPIICTKGTRSGEITQMEKCGLVVDYTIESLREGIIRLRDDPKLCEELGKNGLKAAIEKYNWKIQEEKLMKIYKK